MKVICLLLFTAFNLANGQWPSSNQHIVETSYGRVRGMLMSIGDGKSVHAFIGIPYAAAPTRGNRFRDPQPVVRWMGELEANKRISCPQTERRFIPRNQPNIPEDEDCLYLNVYTPNRPGALQNYPVIFYIHGGDFKHGGKDYLKPDLLLKQDVVVVVINYRLGVFGFLGTDDYHGPGNFGIKDQIAALKWVSSEIHRFNGDRNAVTIMGHDAGAISAHMLMLTKEARGFFNKTVISGGSVFTPWAFQEDPLEQAKRFAWKLNCKGWSRDIVRCLRDKNSIELVNAAREYEGYWFRPVVDKNVTYGLLTDYPERLYQQRQVTTVPLLAGLNANEGTLDYFYRYKREWSNEPSKVVIEEMMKPYMRRYTKTDIVASSVEYHYFSRFNRSRTPYGRQGPGFAVPQNRDELHAKIMGDFLYNAPVDKALRLHSSIGGDTYLYYFMYKGEKSFGPLQNQMSEVTRDSYGVSHMDDLFYMFSSEYDTRVLESGASQPSAELTRFISLFAQHNNLFYSTPKYVDGNFRYTSIPNSNRLFPTANSDYNADDLNFWNTIINDIIEITATPPPYFPYHEYEGFKAATWSLVSLLILSLLLLAILVFIIYRKNREERRTLDFLKARTKDADERELEKL